MIPMYSKFRNIIFLPLLGFTVLNFNCTSTNISEELKKQDKLIKETEELSLSPVWEDRIKAITLACNFSDENFARKDNIIFSALHDIHPAVRIEALTCIKKKPSSHYLSEVINITKKDINSNVKWFAIKTLSE